MAKIVAERKGRKVINFISLNPLTTSVSHHIETSQFIRRANHLTGFYMMGNISGLKVELKDAKIKCCKLIVF